MSSSPGSCDVIERGWNSSNDLVQLEKYFYFLLKKGKIIIYFFYLFSYQNCLKTSFWEIQKKIFKKGKLEKRFLQFPSALFNKKTDRPADIT
jgi:hypothetical protein